jgi:hypothetical protein
MKTRAIVWLSFLICLAFMWQSCCKAGKGGNATLHVSVLSDSKNPIYNTIVYLKYGQSTPPASVTGFDAKIQPPAGSNTVSFTGLKCGTYYLYASGYDSTLKSPVSGGAPLSILHKDRNKTTSTNMYISQ